MPARSVLHRGQQCGLAPGAAREPRITRHFGAHRTTAGFARPNSWREHTPPTRNCIERGTVVRHSSPQRTPAIGDLPKVRPVQSEVMQKFAAALSVATLLAVPAMAEETTAPKKAPAAATVEKSGQFSASELLDENVLNDAKGWRHQRRPHRQQRQGCCNRRCRRFPRHWREGRRADIRST